MDHMNILKRSWEIMWRYRALWIFGIIIAMATAGGAGGSGNSGAQFSPGDNQNSMQQPPFSSGDFESFEQGMEEFGRFVTEGAEAFGTVLIVLGIAFACVMVLLGLAVTVLRYVSQTALIRMVDEYEETEEKRTVGQGFRIGWSRSSWRLFLIDLVIGIPMFIAVILLLALSASPLLLWLTDSNVAGILGTVASVGFFLLVILVIIVVGTTITILKRFFYRACALENLGVFDAIRSGYRLARRNLKDTALMWLILLGLQIAYAIGAAIAGFILLFPAILFGGGAALLFGGFGALIGDGALPWIVGGLVGAPIFLLIFALPLTFLSGLKEVYINNAWTLTYREMKALTGAAVIEAEAQEDEVLDEPEEDATES